MNSLFGPQPAKVKPSSHLMRREGDNCVPEYQAVPFFIFFVACGTVALSRVTAYHCQRDASWRLERICTRGRESRCEDAVGGWGHQQAVVDRRQAFSGCFCLNMSHVFAFAHSETSFCFMKLKWRTSLQLIYLKRWKNTRTHLEHGAITMQYSEGCFREIFMAFSGSHGSPLCLTGWEISGIMLC